MFFDEITEVPRKSSVDFTKASQECSLIEKESDINVNESTGMSELHFFTK